MRLSEEVRERGKPFLGICVGMQLLVGRSDEGGEARGLGLVGRHGARASTATPERKVPHVGWNDVAAAADAPMFKGMRSRVFYFVHSYFVDLADRALVSAHLRLRRAVCRGDRRRQHLGGAVPSREEPAERSQAAAEFPRKELRFSKSG